MTLVSEILQQGYRESNIIAAGQTPKAHELTEGLSRLQNIVTAAYGFEVGEEFSDWPLGLEGVNVASDAGMWTADLWIWPRINARMIAASDSPQTVYLPVRPYDGSRIALIDPASRLADAPVTVDGNGRSIEGGNNFIANTDGLRKLWFYRADLGSWVSITPIALTDPFPFPPEFDDYFITKLAMRINPRYGRTMAEESVASLEEMLGKLRARYRQSESVGVDPALMRTSGLYNADMSGGAFAPSAIGDRGWMG